MSPGYMEEEPIDITKLKYVLYARKSSTDESRQIRSIPDQIRECMELADRLRLRVIGKPLRETQSAKKPHQRPVFTQMIKDIKAGKYDAILSWNPDRLSRNMIEAGTIIDMVDNNQIKDLKFVTHPFTRDANGVMLLGMSFVLSKQYSDDLSQKVTRGVRSSFSEGKSPAPKHGYVRNDKSGLYEPDGKNFDLMCEAWDMRRNGDSLEVISDYMNKNGYGRIVKRTGRIIKMSPKIITDVFRDPFFYGILVQANQKVNLRELYNFQPATTEAVYNQVQELSHRRLKPFNTKWRMSFYPFRAMIRCSFCNHNMVVGPSKSGSGKRYLFYRCDYENCTRKKKSIRAKVLLEFIYTFLEGGLSLTEDDYNQYYEHLKSITDVKRQEIKITIHSAEGRLKYIKGEIKERSLGVVGKKLPTRITQENEKRVTELEVEELEQEQELEKLRGQLSDPEKDRLSLEQFLNLSKNAHVTIKSASPVIKDEICREIFLNFTVDEEKVLSYQLKPPFDKMLETRQASTSRGERN